MVSMTQRPRFSLRLRQRVLRCYEVGLYAVLLGMALAVVLPSVATGADDDTPYCGNAQSSAAVITR
jgi:hypothetical protein